MTAPSGSATGDRHLFIGVMTGTSLDGVDAVLADCSSTPPRLVAHHHRALPAELRAELLALNVSGNDEFHRGSLAAQALVRLYSASVEAVLAQGGVRAAQVRAIGVHGQTVRHRPDLGYTIQLNAPALLAELSGIDVVADFRSRDVAAGGQGAPLVPAFHRLVFAGDTPRAVVNIGGISNVTGLTVGNELGFDAGPGNVLIDAQAQLNRPGDQPGSSSLDSGPALASYPETGLSYRQHIYPILRSKCSPCHIPGSTMTRLVTKSDLDTPSTSFDFSSGLDLMTYGGSTVSGSAKLGMIVAEMLRRKRKITSTTSTSVSTSVNFTSLTDSWIETDRS